MSPDHDELLAALDRGEPFDGGPVERIDTHAAHVFLVGDRAYKIKRPVAFSVLDFTTLEARRGALEAELRLNRRTAPDLYLRVVPLMRTAGGWALDGEGAPVEWVLEMVRFPDAAQLDRRAATGPLPPELAHTLGDTVARFHAEAEERPDMGGHGAMAEVVAGNRTDLEAAVDGLFDPAQVERVQAEARRALERHAGLLDGRRAHGFVRHCHGDLHLANIVALGDRVVPFDCIEFSEPIACIDTMYDLAFLLMDLEDRGQRPAAWAVLDAYLERAGDVPGLRLLPFFMAVRATIRAKVQGLAVADPASEAADGARRYLRLADRLQRPPGPRLVALGGFSGTGKTSVARALAPGLLPVPGAVLLRSDVERKRLAGVPVDRHLPPRAYEPEMSARVYAYLRRRAAQALDTGMSVIVDAVHERPGDRSAVQEVAASAGVPFAGIWLEAPEPVLVDRVRRRAGDASDADAAVVHAQLVDDPGRIDWPRVDASADLGTVAAAAAQRLELAADLLAAATTTPHAGVQRQG